MSILQETRKKNSRKRNPKEFDWDDRSFSAFIHHLINPETHLELSRGMRHGVFIGIAALSVICLLTVLNFATSDVMWMHTAIALTFTFAPVLGFIAFMQVKALQKNFWYWNKKIEHQVSIPIIHFSYIALMFMLHYSVVSNLSAS